MQSIKSITEELTYLMKCLGKDEVAILSLAMKKGIDQLYKETIMKLYIDEDLGKAEAIKLLDIETINDLDYQKKSLKDDIEWGLKND